jgi:hypothetical protein
VSSRSYVPTSQAEIRAEAEEYYHLCEEARKLGIPTSLDDPRSPRTVEGLRRAVEAARS